MLLFKVEHDQYNYNLKEAVAIAQSCVRLWLDNVDPTGHASQGCMLGRTVTLECFGKELE